MSPPETGASKAHAPFEAASSAITRAVDGIDVPKSMKICPGFAAESTPSGPKCTASTSLGSATFVHTKSASFAASAGLDAHDAPAARRPSARAFVREYTVTWKPALSRCPAIDEPMIPVPIHATRALRGSVCAVDSDMKPRRCGVHFLRRIRRS